MTDFTKDITKHFESLSNKNAWLDDLRKQAFTAFEGQGLPTQKVEAWKYVNLKTLLKRQFNYPSARSNKLIDKQLDALTIPELDSYQLVFINGMFNGINSSNHDNLNTGIIIDSLNAALTEHEDLVKPNLHSLANDVNHGFATLNTAFIEDGAFIRIPKNTKLDKPIHLIFINTESNQVNHPRNLIIAESHAEFELIESYVSVNTEQTLTNAITEVILKPGAKLEHIKIQNDGQKSFHLATTQVKQETQSNYINHQFNLGALLSRSDVNTQLHKASQCQLYGLYNAKGKQFMDHHTIIQHIEPHATSGQFYKGILDDYSRAVFNGQVYVHTGAHHSNADQSNKNLLLSKNCEVDTKPQLEIYNDDVKCTHGATVGQLQENELFYLRSRGLDSDTAQCLLTYAFASEMVEKINTLAVKNHLKNMILQLLPAGTSIRELLI